MPHTPGPWKLRRATNGSGDWGIAAEGDENILAEVYEEFHAKNRYSPEEAQANAALISSAPELLEALKKEHGITEECPKHVYDCEVCALIAKAESK